MKRDKVIAVATTYPRKPALQLHVNKPLDPRQPLSFVLFDRIGWHPLLIGFTFGSVTLAVLVALEWMSGRPSGLIAGVSGAALGCHWLIGDYRLGVVNCLLLAYVSTARVVLAKSSLKNCEASFEGIHTEADTLASNRWWGVLPGLAGIALTLLIAMDIAERPIEWTSEYWILPHLFNWVWCFPIGWMGGRFLFALFANGWMLSRRTRSLELESVFDAGPLQGALNQAKVSAMLSIMFLGGVSVHFLDPGAGLGSVVVLLVLFAVAALISGLSLSGAMHAFNLAKQGELERVRKQLKHHEDQLLKGDQPSVAIESLLALESRLRNRSFGLVEITNVGRFIAYAILGLMSWLGAAAVEMMLDYVLH